MNEVSGSEAFAYCYDMPGLLLCKGPLRCDFLHDGQRSALFWTLTFVMNSFKSTPWSYLQTERLRLGDNSLPD